MPLPDGGKTPWPPPYLRPALERMHVWDAWYGGDPDILSAVYGGATAGPDPKPYQYAGGLIGRIARVFWGQPPPPGEQRTKLHIPIAGDLCGVSSDLLFSEPPTLTVDDETTQARLDDIADDTMHATLQTAAELAAALGGVYLRPVYDTELADAPWLDAVHADAAVPEFRWGRLAAVTFWRVVAESDGTVLRHLERHEPGIILHGLYMGTPDELGRPIPLTESPATVGLAPQVNEEGAIPTGYDRLAAVYVPNQASRRWRKTPGCKDLGRSDLDGVEPLMDALDEAYSSWMRDVRLAKGRITAPETMLDSNGPGRGARWDPDREVYSGLNMLHRGDSGTGLTISQFAIRAAEFEATTQNLVERIVGSAGYSVQTFGGSGDVAVTATEVTARERRSMTTRGRKSLRWRPALSEALAALLAIDAQVFRSGVVPDRPSVEFADGVQEDMLTLANTADVLRRAQAASTDVLVRMVHPEWDDDQVSTEVDRIQAETGMSVSDPTQVGADIPPNAAQAAAEGAAAAVNAGLRRPEFAAGE